MNKNTYKPDLWHSSFWRRKTRYYSIELRQNLFGEWIIVRSWGDIRSKRGRQIEQVCESFESAAELFKQAEKRRISRSYQLVTNDL